MSSRPSSILGLRCLLVAEVVSNQSPAGVLVANFPPWQSVHRILLMLMWMSLPCLGNLQCPEEERPVRQRHDEVPNVRNACQQAIAKTQRGPRGSAAPEPWTLSSPTQTDN